MRSERPTVPEPIADTAASAGAGGAYEPPAVLARESLVALANTAPSDLPPDSQPDGLPDGNASDVHKKDNIVPVRW